MPKGILVNEGIETSFTVSKHWLQLLKSSEHYLVDVTSKGKQSGSVTEEASGVQAFAIWLSNDRLHWRLHTIDSIERLERWEVRIANSGCCKCYKHIRRLNSRSIYPNHSHKFDPHSSFELQSWILQQDRVQKRRESNSRLESFLLKDFIKLKQNPLSAR